MEKRLKEDALAGVTESLKTHLAKWKLPEGRLAISDKFKCQVVLYHIDGELTVKVESPAIVKFTCRNKRERPIKLAEWRMIEKLPLRDKHRLIIKALKDNGNQVALGEIEKMIGSQSGYNMLVQMNSLFTGANMRFRIDVVSHDAPYGERVVRIFVIE